MDDPSWNGSSGQCLGLLLTGSLTGVGTFAYMLLTGTGILTALLGYAAVGTGTTLLLAFAVVLLAEMQRRLPDWRNAASHDATRRDGPSFRG